MSETIDYSGGADDSKRDEGTAKRRVAPVVWKGRPGLRTGGAVMAVLVGCLVYDLLRMEGLSGEQNVEYAWRWGRSKEQIYLAELAKSSGAATKPNDFAAVVMRDDDWPGF